LERGKMETPSRRDPDRFLFRDLRPKVLLGTASDRYAGWIGQIYTAGSYAVSSRSKRVGGESFQERVLPAAFFNGLPRKAEWLETCAVR